eukprot:TRINITY_DN11783_c0_g2_i1.p1 TRINITY_DN11783_c0_g2~~TRINITY_DN11783_c0_g2_i1.p1  ORF type:complete len:320 (+),score=44.88 TRINITY_DN11783_c0_g2_i1:55-1014(+)
MAVLLGRASNDKISEHTKANAGTQSDFVAQTLRSASNGSVPTALICCCKRDSDESTGDEQPVSLLDDADVPPRSYLGREKGIEASESTEDLRDVMTAAAPDTTVTQQAHVAEHSAERLEAVRSITFGQKERCEPNFTFEVPVNKNLAGGLGMELDKMDETVMMVSSIRRGGLIALWNETCCEEGCPEKAVQVYDRLTQVNGEGGTGTQLYRSILCNLEAMHLKNLDMVLSFERPTFCTVSIEQGKPMGVSLSINDKAHGIPIMQVMDGAVRDFPDLQVKPHDRIVQVNGMEMKPREMVALMRETTQAFTVKICSYDASM